MRQWTSKTVCATGILPLTVRATRAISLRLLQRDVRRDRGGLGR